MKIIAEIGLPPLSEDEIAQLAEECEKEITEYILRQVPKKSIEELSISCSLQLTTELDLDTQVEILQKYSTGHDLTFVVDSAVEFGADWLERRLVELKGK
jgi:hypothetical protein